jgi:hypothetical protein
LVFPKILSREKTRSVAMIACPKMTNRPKIGHPKSTYLIKSSRGRLHIVDNIELIKICLFGMKIA